MPHSTDDMCADLAIGAAVAGFRVKSVLGEGASGRVFLAEDGAGRNVAIKILSAELARDERFRRRFLRETEIAQSLDHPHVVRTLAAGEEEGLLYLAMEYVDGSDLGQLLRREGRLGPERAVRLVAQVAAALDSAHAAGLVHRDVKPRNVLVAGTGGDERASVCDFGLARHVSSAGSLTGDRGFVGTVDYVPPEQIGGGAIDGRADVYSLGCLLYECLTGERPFDRESELAVVYAHLNEPPPRVTDRRPELAHTFDAVVATALAKAPDARYATCGELAKAARAALAGKAIPARRGRRLGFVLGAAALVAVAATIAGGRTLRDDASAPGDAEPQITQASIAGARLGQRPRYYRDLLGAARRSVLIGPGLFSLAFRDREVAVYFAAEDEPARIVTSWNPEHRTAAGIGPCSTLEELREAYGRALEPASWVGTQPVVRERAWTVGRNLLFSTHDDRTVADVALYEGDPQFTGRNSWRAWAAYVAADETPCR